MNFGKYKRQYFMPPTPTYDWVKKEYIDKAPIWCRCRLKRRKSGTYRANEFR